MGNDTRILRHRPSLPTTTAALLLPVIPAVVASATGSVIANILPDDDCAVTTVIACYVLWGIGEAMSGMIFVLYFQRLYLHRLPSREVIISVFLPVGKYFETIPFGKWRRGSWS